MQLRQVILLLAVFATANGSTRELLQTVNTQPTTGSSTGILNTTDPDVYTWSHIFNQYYGLSKSLNTRSGNASNSYETVFLLANAALSAAAAKNVEAAINSTVSDEAQLLQNAIAYCENVGQTVLHVVSSVHTRSIEVLNITAYTQIAGQAAIETGNAAANGNNSYAIDAANRAVLAAGNGLFAAELYSSAPSPAPTATLL